MTIEHVTDEGNGQTQTVARAERPFSPAVAISNQLVRLLASYIGRGPTKARAALNPHLCVVTFGDTMTRAERNLVAAGQADAVRAMRHVFQATMRQEAVAAVQEILERKVIAYMADIDTDANIAMMAFALEPHSDPRALDEAPQGFGGPAGP